MAMAAGYYLAADRDKVGRDAAGEVGMLREQPARMRQTPSAGGGGGLGGGTRGRDGYGRGVTQDVVRTVLVAGDGKTFPKAGNRLSLHCELLSTSALHHSRMDDPHPHTFKRVWTGCGLYTATPKPSWRSLPVAGLFLPQYFIAD